MSFKCTEDLCVMRMKNDSIFEQGSISQFKIGMRNLTNFESSTPKSRKFALPWSPFDQIIQCFSWKRYRRVMFDCPEHWWKNWSKTNLHFLKWHEEFAKFSPEDDRKSKNLVFCWILLSKVENVWARNVHGSYVPWEWRMIQNFQRTWFVNRKLIWGIW